MKKLGSQAKFANSFYHLLMKVAIMQPYFFPYIGYYRLMQVADVFVIYDNVQFPRRGWVHRNKFTSVKGELQWLTLPLSKHPRSTLINQIQFRDNCYDFMSDQLSRFPVLSCNSECSAILKDLV